MNHIVNVKDANGQWVCLLSLQVVEMLAANGIKIWGMTTDNIMELKTQYNLRNGKYPMTSESIEEAFGAPDRDRLKKIKTFLADMP